MAKVACAAVLLACAPASAQREAIGVGAGLAWVFHPAPPGPEHGIAGQLVFVLEGRPEERLPFTLRLEIGLSALTDVGAGTATLLARVYPLGVDLGPFVWRLGVHFALGYHAPGYSGVCGRCAAHGYAVIGADTELALRVWSRLEIGVVASVEWISEYSTGASHVGLRATYMLP